MENGGNSLFQARQNMFYQRLIDDGRPSLQKSAEDSPKSVIQRWRISDPQLKMFSSGATPPNKKRSSH